MTDPTPFTSYRIAGWSGLAGGLIRILTDASFEDPIMQRSRALVHDGAEFHQLVALFTARTDLAYALVGPVGDVTQVVVHGGVHADLITATETIEIAGTPAGDDWAGHMITAAVLGVTLTVAGGPPHSPHQTFDPGVRATPAPAIATPAPVVPAPVVPPAVEPAPVEPAPLVPPAVEPAPVVPPAVVSPPVLPAPVVPVFEPRVPDPAPAPPVVESEPDRSGPTTSAPPTVPPPPPLRPMNYAAAALRDAGPASADKPMPTSPEPPETRFESDLPDPNSARSQPIEPTDTQPAGTDYADREPVRPESLAPAVSWETPSQPVAPPQRSAGLISDVSWASMLDSGNDPAPAPPVPPIRVEEARWADAGTWSTPSTPSGPADPYRSTDHPGPYDRATPWSEPVDYTSRLEPEPVDRCSPPIPAPEPPSRSREVPPVADISWADVAPPRPPAETVAWAAETAVMPVIQPVRQDLDVTIWRPIAESSVMTRGSGTVSAVRCVDGHLNPLIANSCRVCTKMVPPQEPITVSRPPLGIVRMSTSDVIRLDHGIIFGRDPGSPDGNRADQPYFVMLADKDISRRHLEVLLDGWDVIVVDLNSSNGSAITMPGGVPEVIPAGTRRQLVPGTVVHLSDSISFVFEVTA